MWLEHWICKPSIDVVDSVAKTRSIDRLAPSSLSGTGGLYRAFLSWSFAYQGVCRSVPIGGNGLLVEGLTTPDFDLATSHWK